MNKGYYQQGDVLLFPVDSIPNTCEKEKTMQKPSCAVLAEGEVTGHYHGIEGQSAQVLEDPDTKELYLNAQKDSVVTHQEHGAITIPAGTYQIGIVKEYDHFEEKAREVRD